MQSGDWLLSGFSSNGANLFQRESGVENYPAIIGAVVGSVVVGSVAAVLVSSVAAPAAAGVGAVGAAGGPSAGGIIGTQLVSEAPFGAPPALDGKGIL